MYEFKKKLERYLRVNVGTRPSSYENRVYWAPVSQGLRNTTVKTTNLLYKNYQIEKISTSNK
jgi:hypothetical protein